jgi:hypothetical protein
MNTILWLMQALLAAAFILPGYGKITGSVGQHIADGHIQPGSSIIPIRILGVLEWLGCIGIIAPWRTNILPILTPIAALGFCFIMAAGLFVHARKKEFKMLPLLGVILMISAFVAYCRFKQLN